MMKRAIVCMMVGCMIIAAGCKKETVEKPEPAIKKMLARTDVVLVKHFYEPHAISEDRMSPSPDYNPGLISVKPIWVYEPGKEKQGEKGASFTLVTYTILSIHGDSVRTEGGDERIAFLDLDELRDLDTALGFFESDVSPWRSQEKADHVEVVFDSKDDFQAAIFHLGGDRGEALYLTIGNKSVALNTAKTFELQKLVRDAIVLLDKAE